MTTVVRPTNISIFTKRLERTALYLVILIGSTMNKESEICTEIHKI